MKEIILDKTIYSLEAVTESAMRIRDCRADECSLDRYGIYEKPEHPSFPMWKTQDDALVLMDDRKNPLTTVRFSTGAKEGYQITFTLEDKEQFFGLGDVTRDCLDRRGKSFRMWVVDVNSYAPIPFLMSGRGWALLVNTTFEHFIDVGETEKNTLCIRCEHGFADLTLFTGKDYAQLLERYTSLAGRPQMLPRYAFGLTFVCHTMANVNDMLSDALNFRREDMPCDIIGLEPGWMEKDYDVSCEKKWHPERFPIPYYAPKGPSTFFGALERLGYKLSLWLCCDYDLTWYEEARIGNPLSRNMQVQQPGNSSFEKDRHLQVSEERLNEIREMEKGWFDHLKKFTDQGASCYKLDGAFQVIEHPDRRYGNGMVDEEAHNLYPVIYARQMSQGFSEFTGKRSMIYSAGGYTGIQQYAATWAGDTGGGFEPMVSILNHGLSGHSNASCDMDIFSPESMHFGFLQPWSQLNSWNYFRHPWLLEDESKEMFRYYDRLRYSLFPYLYTAAYQAYTFGMPMMRALPLIFAADPEVCSLLNEYMLGDSLLVGAFLSRNEQTRDGKKVNMYLPEGKWYDWFTGQLYKGGQWIFYDVPAGKGGALFVKAGSLLPMVRPGKNIGDKPFEHYVACTWPDEAGQAYGLMYEDDGIGFGYQKGELRLTQLQLSGNGLTVASEGSYPGMPQISFETQPYHVFLPEI